MAQDKLQYEFKVNGTKQFISDLDTMNDRLAKFNTALGKGPAGNGLADVSKKLDSLNASLEDSGDKAEKLGTNLEDGSKKGGKAIDDLGSNLDNFGKTLNEHGNKGIEFGKKLDKSAKGAEKAFNALGDSVELFGGDSAAIGKVVNALRILGDVLKSQELISKATAASENASTAGKLKAVGEMVAGQTVAQKSTEALAGAEGELADASSASAKSAGGLANAFKLGNPYVIAAALAVGALVVAYNYLEGKKKEQIALERELADELVKTNAVIQERINIERDFNNSQLDLQVQSLQDQLSIMQLQNGSLTEQENIRKRILSLQVLQQKNDLLASQNRLTQLRAELTAAEQEYKRTTDEVAKDTFGGLTGAWNAFLIQNGLGAFLSTPKISAENKGKISAADIAKQKVQNDILKTQHEIELTTEKINQLNDSGLKSVEAQYEVEKKQERLRIEQELRELLKEKRDIQNKISNSKVDANTDDLKAQLKTLDEQIKLFEKKRASEIQGSISTAVRDNLSQQLKLVTDTYEIDFREFKINEQRKRDESNQTAQDRIDALNREIKARQDAEGKPLTAEQVNARKELVFSLTEEIGTNNLNFERKLLNKSVEQQQEFQLKLIDEFGLTAEQADKIFKQILNVQVSTNQQAILDEKELTGKKAVELEERLNDARKATNEFKKLNAIIVAGENGITSPQTQIKVLQQRRDELLKDIQDRQGDITQHPTNTGDLATDFKNKKINAILENEIDSYRKILKQLNTDISAAQTLIDNGITNVTNSDVKGAQAQIKNASDTAKQKGKIYEEYTKTVQRLNELEVADVKESNDQIFMNTLKTRQQIENIVIPSRPLGPPTADGQIPGGDLIDSRGPLAEGRDKVFQESLAKLKADRTEIFNVLQTSYDREYNLATENQIKVFDLNKKFGLLNLANLIAEKKHELEILKKADDEQIKQLEKTRKEQLDKIDADSTLSKGEKDKAKADVNVDIDGKIKTIKDKFKALNDAFNGSVKDMINGAAELLQSFSDTALGVAEALNNLANVQDQIQIDKDQKEIDRLQELQDKKEEIISQSNSNINDLENQLKTAKGNRHAYLLGLLATEQRHLQDAENEKEALAEKEKQREDEIKQLQKDTEIRNLKLERASTISAGVLAEARIIASLAEIPFGVGLVAGIAAAAGLAVETGLRVAALDKQIAAASEAADGGELVGKSHLQGGIRGKGAFGNIEVEGGEFIVKKRAVELNRDVIERLNQYGDQQKYNLVPADQNSIKYRAALGAQVREDFGSIQNALVNNNASGLEPIVQAIRDLQIVVGVDQITDQQKKVVQIEQLASTKRN